MGENKSERAEVRKSDTLNGSTNSTKKKSKSQMVVEYIADHPEGLTSMDAFRMWNVTRLASIICDYRRRGYGIATIMEISADGTRYARYVWGEDE